MKLRHSLHPEHGPDMEIYTKLTEYLYLAKQKTDFDLAEAYYIRKNASKVMKRAKEDKYYDTFTEILYG